MILSFLISVSRKRTVIHQDDGQGGIFTHFDWYDLIFLKMILWSTQWMAEKCISNAYFFSEIPHRFMHISANITSIVGDDSWWSVVCTRQGGKMLKKDCSWLRYVHWGKWGFSTLKVLKCKNSIWQSGGKNASVKYYWKKKRELKVVAHWHMPLVPALRSQKEENLWVQD